MIKYNFFKKIQTDEAEKSSSEKYDIIVEAAENLPYLIALLRQQNYHAKTSLLYTLIPAKIGIFTEKLEKAAFPKEEIDQAKYLICAAMDEAFLCASAPSGVPKESLISCFYREELGGENFFTILEGLCKNSSENIYLIRFAYLLLCLGFEGKYAVATDGQDKLMNIKEKMRALIAGHIELEDRLNQNPSSVQSVNIRLTRKEKLKIISFSVATILVVYIILLHILGYKQSAIQKLINLYI